MNGFKTSSLNRKRKQQLSRTARTFVMNRLNAYLKPAQTDDLISPDILSECKKIRKVSTDAQARVSIPPNTSAKKVSNAHEIVQRSSCNVDTINHQVLSSVETPNNEKQFDLREELANWSKYTGTPSDHVDSLLRILKTFFEKQITEKLPPPKLPLTNKTLLKTPRTNDIVPMDGGHVLYFSLQTYLETFLAENTIAGNIINLDIGSDGVGVATSSTRCLWPLLVNVVGFRDIFMVSCFHGSTKPVSANDFLEPFAEEFLKL